MPTGPRGAPNLGNLHATQGRFDDAVAAFRGALAARSDLRAGGAEPGGSVIAAAGWKTKREKTLREALMRDPRSAPAHFALGLSLARQKRTAESLKELAAAARLAPGQRALCVRPRGSAERQRPGRRGVGANWRAR